MITFKKHKPILRITDNFVINYHFSALYISHSEVDEIIENVHNNKSKVIRNAFDNLPLCIDDEPIFDLGRSKIILTPIVTEKKNTFLDKIGHRFFKKEKYYTDVIFEVEYYVELYQNFDVNYIKLKDFKRYETYLGDGMREYKAMFYLSTHDQFERSLYVWNDEKHFS